MGDRFRRNAHQIADIVRQLALRQPLPYSRWQQERLLRCEAAECRRHQVPSLAGSSKIVASWFLRRRLLCCICCIRGYRSRGRPARQAPFSAGRDRRPPPSSRTVTVDANFDGFVRRPLDQPDAGLSLRYSCGRQQRPQVSQPMHEPTRQQGAEGRRRAAPTRWRSYCPPTRSSRVHAPTHRLRSREARPASISRSIVSLPTTNMAHID